MAVAALVLGISSIVFALIGLGWLGGMIAIVGIVLGVLARKAERTSMATAGMVCSIIGVVLGVLFYIACFSFVGTFSVLFYQMLDSLPEIVESLPELFENIAELNLCP